MSWNPFDSGKTIDLTGGEGGRIIRDEEHTGGARITLEQQCKMAPFAITCGIYGWMVHASFYADQMAAEDDYDHQKTELARILSLIPRDDVPDFEDRLDAAEDAMEAFQSQFS